MLDWRLKSAPGFQHGRNNGGNIRRIVRPELVEGSFFSTVEGRSLDKAGPNGIWACLIIASRAQLASGRS
jgi:hypothetical protein